MFPSKSITLPVWIKDVVAGQHVYPTIQDRMGLAIELAAHNVRHGGGPFGACVFESESGKLIAPGVNLVVQENCSLAHAEAVALMIAQQVCQSYDLGADALPSMDLVSSAQPCIQCFGNVWWSGIKRLIVGARKEDVEAITGFDEGPLPRDWVAQLQNRSPLPPVTVIRDVMRSDARSVLEAYIARGGTVYNPASR